MENQIRFEIKDCPCSVCKGPIVEEFWIVRGQHNGVIGQGGHAPSWIESEFYCPSCGIKYKPTEQNKLTQNEKLRKDEAEKILRSTRRVNLEKDLRRGEVFEICKSAEGLLSYLPHNPSTFSKGDFLRAHSQSRNLRTDSFSFLNQKPFIVPSNGRLKSKLVFWAEYKQHKVLVKPKKKVAPKERNSKFLSKTQVITDELAKEGKVHTLEQRKSKPLPKGSVEAVKVFCESLGYGREFYIPKDAI